MGKLVTLIGIVVLIVILREIELKFRFITEKREKERGEDEITTSDNRLNSYLMLGGMISLFVMFAYQFFTYKHLLLPISASAHGPIVDKLQNVTFTLITIVFVITQFILGYFAFRYYSRKNKPAYYYPHNNKVELIWTIIPTIVLSCLITYGLIVWGQIMKSTGENAMVVEIYGKQFQWIARYAGSDTTLGNANYKLIERTNVLGLDSSDTKSMDDIITSELHLPVNKAVLMKFRSQDVIHSAYLPHFRVQMNCVPGMTTQFQFTPTITTEEMRKETKNENFDYILLCNKICGIIHYFMKMKVVVESEEDYQKWLDEQPAFFAKQENKIEIELDSAATEVPPENEQIVSQINVENIVEQPSEKML